MELSKGNRLILKQFDQVDRENLNSDIFNFLLGILKVKLVGNILFLIRLLLKK